VVINDVSVPGVLTGSMIELIFGYVLRFPNKISKIMKAFANASNCSHKRLYNIVSSGPIQSQWCGSVLFYNFKSP
jgi:hypothetical protein